jgi:hypothetical protein
MTLEGELAHRARLLSISHSGQPSLCDNAPLSTSPAFQSDHLEFNGYGYRLNFEPPQQDYPAASVAQFLTAAETILRLSLNGPKGRKANHRKCRYQECYKSAL